MRELSICKNSGRLYGGSSSSDVPITAVINISPIRFEDETNLAPDSRWFVLTELDDRYAR